jgi:hypothetical protein
MASVQVPSPTSGGDVSPTGNLPGTSGHNKMRKRTKTGCLTCRKRRIKCGEERPTCANCIKSKRQCEGYNQRVIFKTPIENWPNHPGHVSTIQYHTSMLPGTRNPPYRPQHSTAQPQESPLSSIQPRPLSHYDFSVVDPVSEAGLPTPHQVILGEPHGYAQETSYQQPLPSPHHQQPLISPHHHGQISPAAASYFPQPSPVHPTPPVHYSHEPSVSYQASPHYGPSQNAYQQLPVSYDNNSEAMAAMSQAMSHQSHYQRQPVSQAEDQSSYHSHSSVSPRSDHYTSYTEVRPALARYNSHPQANLQHIQVSSAEMGRAGPYNYQTAVSHADFNHSSYSTVQIPIHDMTPDVKNMQQPVLGMSRV